MLRFGTESDMPKTFPIGDYALVQQTSGPGTGGGGGGGGGGTCTMFGFNGASGTFHVNGPVDSTTTAIDETFDLTFTRYGQLTGTFTAPVCVMATELSPDPMYCGDPM